MNSTIQLTAAQAKELITRHGKITMSGIRELLGIKEKKVSKVKVKQGTKQFSQLKFYLKIEGIEFVEEHKFCEYRDFRFDLCIPEYKIAFEYNGIFSEKSRHTTVKGYSEDRNKINLAIGLGWKVLEYTPINLDNAISDIEKILKQK